MLRDYADIISRLGEPLWYDDHGVPRYDPFKPDACGVYDDIVAFLAIRCQSCQREFSVAVCFDAMGRAALYDRGPDATITLPKDDDHGGFHYGDPPRHDGCAGDTMNCDHGRLLQLWERKTFDGWHRIDEKAGETRRVWPAQPAAPASKVEVLSD